MAEKTNQQKLDDIWWILCSDQGREFLAELVGSRAASKTLNTSIKRGGGLGGETSLAASTSWGDAHVNMVLDATAAPDTANIEAIKQAVADGLKDGVHVDVTVNGGK